MTRTAKVIIVGVIAAVVLLVSLGQAQATPRKVPDKIGAVIRETDRTGAWPHLATPAEKAGVRRVVLLAHTPRELQGFVNCNFANGGTYIGRGACAGLTFTLGTASPAGGARPRLVVTKYRVKVQVWEDGSFRFSGLTFIR